MTALKSIPAALSRRSPVRRNIVRWLLVATGVVSVLLIGYCVMAGLIGLVMATADGARFSVSGLLLGALPGWLAAHQVPLSVQGAPMTVFPLMPTALLMLLIGAGSSQVARRARIHRATQARTLIVAMGLSHAVVGASVAMMLDGSIRALPAEAFAWCGLTATLASTAGVANRCGLTYAIWGRVDADTWSGLRVGLVAIAAVVGAGAFVVFAGVCLSAPEMFESLRRTGSVGDAFGSTLLSLLYVPNAVIAGWAFAAGTGLEMGRHVFQPLHATPVPMPDFPLLAVLPSGGASLWWALVFLLPAAVGVLVGWGSLSVHASRVRRMRAVVVAALVASVGTLALAGMVGGRLGGGEFDPVTLRPGLLAVGTFCWIAIPASAVAWFVAARTDVPTETPDGSGVDVTADAEDESADDNAPAGGAPRAADETSAFPEDAADRLVAEIEQIDPSEFDVDSRTGDEPPR